MNTSSSTCTRSAALLALLLYAASSARAGTNEGCQAIHEAPLVPLLQLIANPAQHSGECVRVVGFCSLEFEGTAIYLHEEDYRKCLTTNSLVLDVDHVTSAKPSPAHEKYCIVQARFTNKRGRNGRPGWLDQISILAPIPSRAELAPRAGVPE